MQFRIFVYLCTVISLLTACNGCNNDKKGDNTEPIKPVEDPYANVKVPGFNEDSAYAYVARQVAFGPRVNNTRAHIECGNWLIAELKKHSDTVYVQSCVLTGFDNKALQSRNIIASFNPKADKRIILSSHWDTRPFADQDDERSNEAIDGANDGASGVGILMEVARQLHDAKPGIGIDIILFDAEDYGQPDNGQPYKEDSYCLGSQYWAKNPHLAGYHADFGILLDMVGAQNATFTKEGTSMMYAPSYMNYVWNTANEIGYGAYFQYQQTGTLIDDHKYVNEITGIPMIDIIHRTDKTPSGFGAYWHTHDDNIQSVDKKTLKAVGQTLLYTIYRYNAVPQII